MAGTLGLAVLETGVDLDGLDKGLDQGEKAAETAGKGMSNKLGLALGGLATVGAAAGAAVVAGVVAIGGAALDVGSQIKQAANTMQAELGVSADVAEHLADVAANVFGNNFTGSIEEAAQVVAEARRQLGDLAGEELQQVSEAAVALSDVFGVDYTESLNSAQALTAAFGLSGQQSMDLITSGMQNGLNTSGDFLDSIGEYSNLFAAAGFSADQMYSIMASGAQAGVLGTDKIADAVKEMGIILNEGSDDTKAAFDAIGLSFDDIAASVAAGDESWADYFNEIVGGINAIEDPIARSQAQVAIFGTMAEDLGVNFTEGLTTSVASLEEMAGATESLNAKYDNLGSVMEGFKRQALLALAPLGESLLEIANDIMPVIEDAFEWFSSSVIPLVTGALESVIGFIGDVIDGLQSGRDPIDAFTGALEGLIPDAVLEAIGTLIDILQNLFATALENAKLAADGFRAALSGDFATFFGNLGEMAANGIQAMGDAFGRLVELVGPALEDTAQAIINWVGAQDWGAIGLQVAELLVEGLMRLIELANEVLSEAAAAFTDWVSSVDWVDVGFQVVTLILEGLKWLVTELPPLLAEWAGLFWDWVTTYDWAGLAQQLIDGLVAGLHNAGGAVVEALKGIASGAVDAFKEFFGISSPSRLMAELGAFIMDGLGLGIRDNAKAPAEALAGAAAELRTDAAAAFSEAVVAIVDAIMPTIDALLELAGATIPDARSVFDQLRQQMHYMVESMGDTAWQITADGVRRGEEMAGATEAVVGALVATLDALERLATVSVPAGVHALLSDLVELTRHFVAAMATAAADLSTDALNDARAFADAAGEVVAVIGPAVEALGALPEYANIGDVRAVVQRFALDLALVVTELARALEHVATPFESAIEAAGEISGSVRDVVGVIQPGIDALLAIRDYIPVGGLQATIEQFARDLVNVAMQLVRSLISATRGVGIQNAVAYAAELSQHIREIVGLVQPGVDMLAALGEYVSNSDIQAITAQFAADLTAVALELVSAFVVAAKYVRDEALAAALAFAADVATLAGSVATALESLNTIATAERPETTGALDYILAQAQLITDTFTSAAATLNGGVAAAIDVFQAQVADVVASVELMLAHLARLMTANVPGSLQAVLDAMLRAIETTAVPTRQATAAIAQAIQDAMNAPDWVLLGRNIAYGIAAGIRRGTWAITQAAQQAAQAALSAAQQELGIASPSKRAGDEIGDPFVEGIAERIRAASGLRAAVTQLVNVAMPQMAPQPALAGAGAGWPESITLRIEGRVENESITITRRNGVLSAARARGMR